MNQSLVVGDSLELTVPGTVRVAVGDFKLEHGVSYLLEFEIFGVKLEGTPGAAMYLSVSLNCAGSDGETSGSVAGTQNFVTGQEAVMRNQMLIVSVGDEMMNCNLLLSSPNPEAAAAGATLKGRAQWGMTKVEGLAEEVEAGERLPRTIAQEGRDVLFANTVELDNITGDEVRVLNTLHLTTCTGVNGSQENGKYWCDREYVDERGSKIDLEARVDVLDEGGEVCGELGVFSKSIHIDRRTHHQLVDLRGSTGVPNNNCGDTLRVTVVVENQGPAPLVAHGAGSSMLIIQGG